MKIEIIQSTKAMVVAGQHPNKLFLMHIDCKVRSIAPYSKVVTYHLQERLLSCGACSMMSNEKNHLILVALLDMKYKRIETIPAYSVFCWTK